MNRSGYFATILTLLILTWSPLIMAADIPVEPYIEASFATEGPLSLFCSPDGGGYPFTQAFDPSGNLVDGTLTIILYNEWPPWGEPVANYPKEDIWLMDIRGNLAMCSSGTICDVNTDADGMTFWSAPLKTGGHAEPDGDNRMAISVSGWILEGASLEEFRINSADLNGDQWVSLHDIVLFSEIFFGPYAYEGDLHWDGVINLSDLAEFARTYGAECP